MVPNAEGSRTTPSVVAFTEDGERLVGQLARRQSILNPKGTIYSAKRFIGRRFAEVAEEARAVAYDVVEGPGGTARFDVRGIRSGAYVDPQIYGNDLVVVGENNARRLLGDVLGALPVVGFFTSVLR